MYFNALRFESIECRTEVISGAEWRRRARQIGEDRRYIFLYDKWGKRHLVYWSSNNHWYTEYINEEDS